MVKFPGLLSMFESVYLVKSLLLVGHLRLLIFSVDSILPSFVH